MTSMTHTLSFSQKSVFESDDVYVPESLFGLTKLLLADAFFKRHKGLQINNWDINGHIIWCNLLSLC